MTHDPSLITSEINPVEISNSAPSTQDSELRQSDQYGPLARNWEEVRERARIAFGLTHEEAARRAELRRKYFEEHPVYEDDDYNSDSTLNAQPFEETKPWNVIDLLKEVTAELEREKKSSGVAHISGGTSSESPN